jgi:hypothetical protein
MLLVLTGIKLQKSQLLVLAGVVLQPIVFWPHKGWNIPLLSLLA